MLKTDMIASVYIAISLDGFIARENGELDWLPGSEDIDEKATEDFGYQTFMDSVDVLIMGRKTFEQVLSFGSWPYAEKRVIVLSNHLTQIPAELPESVEIKSGTPGEIFKDLESSGAKHLYVDGGSTIQGFLNAGLIQKLILTRIPILIGQGIPLFGVLSKDIKLTHIETKSFANGFVQSHYDVDNNGQS